METYNYDFKQIRYISWINFIGVCIDSWEKRKFIDANLKIWIHLSKHFCCSYQSSFCSHQHYQIKLMDSLKRECWS